MTSERGKRCKWFAGCAEDNTKGTVCKNERVVRSSTEPHNEWYSTRVSDFHCEECSLFEERQLSNAEKVALVERAVNERLLAVRVGVTYVIPGDSAALWSATLAEAVRKAGG